MERKLYVKGRCFTCLGRKQSCAYCDADGQAYIEASDKTLQHWYLSLDIERKKEVLALFNKEDAT